MFTISMAFRRRVICGQRNLTMVKEHGGAMKGMNYSVTFSRLAIEKLFMINYRLRQAVKAFRACYLQMNAYRDD